MSCCMLFWRNHWKSVFFLSIVGTAAVALFVYFDTKTAPPTLAPTPAPTFAPTPPTSAPTHAPTIPCIGITAAVDCDGWHEFFDATSGYNCSRDDPCSCGRNACADGRITKLFFYDQQSVQGTIPDSLTKLTKLSQLSLYDSNLHGTIPESIGKLTELTKLYLSDLPLHGTIPQAFCELDNLEKCVMYGVSYTCPLPTCTTKVSACQIDNCV